MGAPAVFFAEGDPDGLALVAALDATEDGRAGAPTRGSPA